MVPTVVDVAHRTGWNWHKLHILFIVIPIHDILMEVIHTYLKSFSCRLLEPLTIYPYASKAFCRQQRSINSRDLLQLQVTIPSSNVLAAKWQGMAVDIESTHSSMSHPLLKMYRLRSVHIHYIYIRPRHSYSHCDLGSAFSISYEEGFLMRLERNCALWIGRTV